MQLISLKMKRFLLMLSWTALVSSSMIGEQILAADLVGENGKLNSQGRDLAIRAVEKTVEWLNRSIPADSMMTASSGASYVRRHGMRKKVMRVQSVDNPNKVEVYKTEVVTSKLCHTMHYLVEVGQSHSIQLDTRDRVAELANAVIDMFQVKQGKWAGGFVVSEEYRPLSTQTTAVCALYLLKSADFFKQFGSHRHLQTKILSAARLANLFLEKMQNPSLIDGLSDFRFNQPDGEKVKRAAFWLDGVSNGRLMVSTTAWNFVAYAVRKKLEAVDGGKPSKIRDQNEMHFYFDMAMNSYEGFAPRYYLDDKDNRAASLISYSGLLPNISSFDNNTYLRRYANTSIGSDMPEYVILTLMETGNISQQRSLLNKLLAAPALKKIGVTRYAMSDADLTLNKIDPFVGFSGIFFIGSINPVNRSYQSTGNTLFNNYQYYDFDAIVGESKNKFYPCRVQRAVARIIDMQEHLYPMMDTELAGQSHLLFASLSLDLKPLKPSPAKLTAKERSDLNGPGNTIQWDADENVTRYTMAASTVAHNGLLVLKALEASTDSQVVCQ